MKRVTRYLTMACAIVGGGLYVSSASSQGIEIIDRDQKTIINPKPSSLSLKRLDERTALIMGRFLHRKAGGEVPINIENKTLFLSDNGQNGDEEPGDGIFSLKIEFDFELFAKANQVLAEVNADQKPRLLFSSNSRQLLGEQRIQVEGDSLLVTSGEGKQSQEAFLPLNSDTIKMGQVVKIPVGGLALGVPPAFRLKAPTSIADSLMITDTTVVQDFDKTWSCPTGGASPVGNATGEWTFWQLMENIANGSAATSDYIKQLFDHWNSVQVVNSHNVNARPNVYQSIIEQWEIRSGGLGATLLPEHSPFRLLGIVLRADLRGGGGVYGGGDAGEGRFVFSLHDGNCNSMPKTLILEYKVPIAGCSNVRSWAQDWKALASSVNYNDDLAALTKVFSDAGANPSAPNQSAISQLRTNEFLAGSPLWELREFVLPSSGGFLTETTVKQEPHVASNNSPLLANYVNANWPALVGPPAGQHEVTELHLGTPFLAGAAPAPLLWNVPSAMLTVPTTPSPITPLPATIRDDALFQLGLNTCSGCHTVETGTGFAHLHYNTPPGVSAILSGFLTGTSLPDPRNGAIPRSFNDLARRAADLDAAASMACPTIGTVTVGNVMLHELSVAGPLIATH